MLFMICPTCGDTLGNKEPIYIEGMKKICEDVGVDDDQISQGNLDKNPEYVEKRKALLQKVAENPCCRMRLMNAIDIVAIVL